MASLTGVSVAMRGTERVGAAGGARAEPGDWLRAISRLAKANLLGGMQMLGTIPGLRARELDRAARRDVAAILRREGIVCGGIDLPIPPAHFAEAAHVDRALAAARDAMGLAAELVKLTEAGVMPVVALWLPRPVPMEVIRALASEADITGCAVADLTWPMAMPTDAVDEAESSATASATQVSNLVGSGLDAAVILMASSDPSATALRHAQTLRQARLSDARGGKRVSVGRGILDVLAYRVALELTAKDRPSGMVVVDLEGLDDPAVALGAAVAAWAG